MIMNDRDASSMISRAVSVIVSPSASMHVDPTMIGDVTPKFILPSSSTAKDLLRDLAQKSLNPFSPSSMMAAIGKDYHRQLNPTRSATTTTTVNGVVAASAEQSANRMSYPREFKLLVISYYFQHGQNKYRTCKEFHITKSMLNGWLQKVDKIQQSRPGSLKSGRSGRKPQFPTVEKQLYHVYQACLTAGKKVGNRWLRETAKLIAQEQCTPEELNGMCQFSERWLCNFKKRYNINLTKDWNGDNQNNQQIIVKPSSDGVSYSPTPETCSTPTNCEADSSTSPKNDGVRLLLFQEQPSTTMMEDIVVDDDDDEEEPDEKNSFSHQEKQIQMKIVSKKSSSIAAPIEKRRQALSPMLKSPPPTKTPVKSSPSLKIGFQPYEPGRRGRKVQFPQVEEVLYKNLCVKQTDGVRVSNRWLQDEARRLAVELCPEMFTNAFKSARCMFSEHWLHNFKKRYGISLKQQNTNNEATSKNLSISSSASTPNLNGLMTDKQISNETLNNILSINQQQQQSTTATLNSFWKLKNSLALEPNAARSLDGVGASAVYHQHSHRFGGVGVGDSADDLPTMVPLTTLSQSLTKINLAEWYSKISNANNVNECLQMLTDEVRMRKGVVATSSTTGDAQTTTDIVVEATT